MAKSDLKPTILVIEDEESIATLIEYNLDKEGFRVITANDGAEGLELIKNQAPDLVLLDWMLPSISGIEICERLRKTPETASLPIIMITARGEESDRVRGLNTGADDYIVKPFSPSELVARTRAVLRRLRPVFSGKALEYKGLKIDLDQYKASYKNTAITLGPTEFKLLCQLMERPGTVYSREQLLNSVWGQDSSLEPRTVDVHIGRLRKALEDSQKGLGKMLKTVRSAGYSLSDL